MSNQEITEETVRARMEVERQQQVVGCSMNKVTDLAERLADGATILRTMVNRPDQVDKTVGLSRNGTLWQSPDGSISIIKETLKPLPLRKSPAHSPSYRTPECDLVP